MLLIGRIRGELTIERVCLLMNIVPCHEINLGCEEPNDLIELMLKTNLFMDLGLLFFFLSTGNLIGETEATPLSDALKSNTTLTKLNLKSEHKRNNIHQQPNLQFSLKQQ